MLIRYVSILLASRFTHVLCVDKPGIYCQKSGCRTMPVLVPVGNLRSKSTFTTTRKAPSRQDATDDIIVFIVEWIFAASFIRTFLFFKSHGFRLLRKCLSEIKREFVFPKRLRLSAWNIVFSFDEACTTFLHWTFAAHGPWNANYAHRSAAALATDASLGSLTDFIGDEESEQATNASATVLSSYSYESSSYTSNYTKSESEATSTFTPINRRVHNASLLSSSSYDSSAYTSYNTNFESKASSVFATNSGQTDSEATTVLASRNTSRHALGRRAPRDRGSSNPLVTCLPKVVTSHKQNVNTSNSNGDSYYDASCYDSESSVGYDTRYSTRGMYSSSWSIISNLLGYISSKSRKKSREEVTARGKRNTTGSPLQYTSQKQHNAVGTHETKVRHTPAHKTWSSRNRGQ